MKIGTDIWVLPQTVASTPDPRLPGHAAVYSGNQSGIRHMRDLPGTRRTQTYIPGHHGT